MDRAIHPSASDTIHIAPGGVDRRYWRDLWRHRELFHVLAWRDIAVRYKQTILGVSWAVLRPLVTMVVFTVVFGRMAGLPSLGDAPYALMVFAGLLPWQFFSSAVSDASMSLVGNANLIGKVYFPRLAVPMATIVVAFVDFLISLVVLAGLMAWYRVAPGWTLLALPFLAGMAFLACLGPGLWLASLNVKYRDFRYVVPFLVQIGLYVSPVGFSSQVVPERWRLLYALNPMVGVIDGFRWAILGGRAPLDLEAFGLGWAVILLLLWRGMRSFRRTERSFADLV
jgi:lipopolysaccharide transport system permease protein